METVIIDFTKKEYQKYEVTEDLDMNIDHVMYVTEHMMNYLIGKEEKLSVVTTVEGKEQDFFNERDRMHMRDVRNLFLGGIKVGGVCLIVAAAILTMFKKREKDWKRLFCRAYSIALGVMAGHRCTAWHCFQYRFYDVFYDFS